jgi:hypothetical protein
MNVSSNIQPSALDRFVEWLASNSQRSNTDGRLYNYLPRSDSHSIALCRFIVQDLVLRSEVIREKAKQGRVAFGLNVRHTFDHIDCRNIAITLIDS